MIELTASEVCGCALEDCPYDGTLLQKLLWIRYNNMGRGTDGEINAADLDRLIDKLQSLEEPP